MSTSVTSWSQPEGWEEAAETVDLVFGEFKVYGVTEGRKEDSVKGFGCGDIMDVDSNVVEHSAELWGMIGMEGVRAVRGLKVFVTIKFEDRRS